MKKVENSPQLQNDPHLCMSPWTHLHIWPEGRVLPCCMSDPQDQVGSLTQEPLKAIFNSKKMKEMRLAMLDGKRHESCRRCFEIEDVGGNSHRNFMNEHFGHHYEKINQTLPDGSAEPFFPYWDIRFSNVCNFKCRTCGLPLSSGWYEDNNALYGQTGPKYRKLVDRVEDLWAQLEPHVSELEEVYFVGGEPMLMEEHWRVLDLLIEKKLKHVRLRYNTNFSLIKYAKHDAIQMWNQFSDVAVQASLDGAHGRGEYLRKGQNWGQTVQNRERLLREAPHVKFTINATVSLFNVLHIPDFHKEWIEAGYVTPEGILLNLLLNPEYYRIQVLPEDYKMRVLDRYRAHLSWLESIAAPHAFAIAKGRFETTMNFLEKNDQAELSKDFLKVTEFLDMRREEDFRKTFPELSEVFV